MKYPLLASATLAISIATAPATAEIEEVIVTAQKRQSTLLDTPIAVSAVGGLEVERAQARDVRDISTLVPSLQVNTFASSSNTAFSIRQIGSTTFNFGVEPAVGVFVDGVYRSRNGASINDFLGLERVEVLRGPQSTLFGKNTTAGVINFITKRPNQELWEFEAEASAANYSASIIKAGVSGPLSDNVAIRLDANLNRRDGFVDNLVDGNDVNNREREGFRGQLLFTPTDNIDIRLIADYNDIDENCCAAGFVQYNPGSADLIEAFGGIAAPEDVFDREIAIDGGSDGLRAQVENQGFSGEINWDTGAGTWTSITAYREYDEFRTIDSDFVNLELAFPNTTTNSYETFTQEIRFASPGGETVDWIAGAYYFQQDLNTDNQVIIAPFARPFFDALTSNGVTGLETALGVPAGTFLGAGQGIQREDYVQNNDTFSIFAQADWHVTDRLTITAGLRYLEDSRDVTSDILIDDQFAAVNLIEVGAAPISLATGIPVDFLTNPENFQNGTIPAGVPSPFDPAVNAAVGLIPFQFFPPSPNIQDLPAIDGQSQSERDDDALTGNLIFAYDVNESTNVYVSYARGFKAGGFSLDPGSSRAGSSTFDPEKVDSYEIGLKARLLDNSLSIDTAFFQQDVDDFQNFTFVGNSFFPSNASIRVRGWEMDATWAATDNLTLTAAFLLLTENEFTEFNNAPCPVNFQTIPGCQLTLLPGAISPTAVQDGAGLQQTNAPDFSGVVTANYFREINKDYSFFARAEVSYNEATPLNLFDEIQENDDVVLVGSSIGIETNDGIWQLQLWGRNLTGEEFFQTTFDNTVGLGVNGYPNDPRTYGLTLRYKN